MNTGKISIPKFKRCRGSCDSILPLTEEYFYFRKSSKNGKFYSSSYCRVCEREKSRKARRTQWNDPLGKIAIKAQNHHFRRKPERIAFDKAKNRARYITRSEFNSGSVTKTPE